MENVQTLVHTALTTIGAAQAIAVALTTGFIMKDYNQTVVLTLAALAIDRFIAIIRNAMNGQNFGNVVESSWHSLMSLPMGQFLAASIAFGLIICIAFNLKSMLKKL
jgi:hypothetical protein